ncbi:glycosyltransferase family 21 protein [Lactarius hatsudake]|nr:glycosyltransferase family 21 protein [Lactarius hatsudake]
MTSPTVDDDPTAQDWHHVFSVCLAIVGLIWTVRLLDRVSLDTNLLENLESSFRQDYPNFEILLSVADEHDKALPVVYELLAKYPNVNARVIIGDVVDVGANPKVNNLIRPYNEAAHDILWQLDSNVAVGPGALARAVEILTRPFFSSELSPAAHRTWSSFGARVEAAFLNTNLAKLYIAINAAAVESCVVGKSNLFRRSDLERLDGSLIPRGKQRNSGQQRGLAAFSRFSVEDNMIGLSLWHELDVRHDLSCDVAYNTLGDMSLSDYLCRRAVIGAASTQFLTGVTHHLFLPIHFILWILIDLDVCASLAGRALPSSMRWEFLVAWVVKEVLAFPIWLLAIMGDEGRMEGEKVQGYAKWRDGSWVICNSGLYYA